MIILTKTISKENQKSPTFRHVAICITSDRGTMPSGKLHTLQDDLTTS